MLYARRTAATALALAAALMMFSGSKNNTIKTPMAAMRLASAAPDGRPILLHAHARSSAL
jgi:hypothetical protein